MFSVEKFCCQLGPNCICPSVELAIKTGDGGEGSRTIGRLSNMWAGFNAKGLCSRADNYSVEFDRLLLPGHKMAMLGSAILVDFLFFERRGEDKRRGGEYYYGAPTQSAMMR